MTERYFNLFSLNAPAWSLFWEYIANIFYILILYKVSKNILLFLSLLGAIGIFYIASLHTNLSGGWGGPNFWDGGVRVFYSFLAGMVVYRSNWIIKNKLGFIGISVLLMIAFFAPYRNAYNWITEPILVVFYFPLLVSLGAGATLTRPFQKIAKLSGELSYPLYMVHYPFVWVFLTYVAVVKPTLATLSYVIPLSVIALITLSYLVMVFVDEPMRKYFKNKLIK
jgi:peptidoglycan/LPS O-acetylase OafA/YrhL